MKKFIYIILGISLGGAFSVYAATPLTFPVNGGTGTSTAPTYGKMLVGNASGTYTLTSTSSLGISATPGGSNTQVQFNDSSSFGGDSFFTWNKTNKRLFLGPAPSVPDGYTPGNLVITGPDTNGASGEMMLWNPNAAAGFASMQFQTSRGSLAVPTALVDGDNMGSLEWLGTGTDSSLDTGDLAANIQGYVDGAPDVGKVPGKIVFSTTPVGGYSPLERMTIKNTGFVGIGTSSPFAPLSVSGTTTQWGNYAHFGTTVCGSTLSGIGQAVELCGDNNSDNQGVGFEVQNNNSGNQAFSGMIIQNDLATVDNNTNSHFFGSFLNSSGYTSTTFGTGQSFKNQAIIQNSDGLLTLISSTSTTALNPDGINFLTGGSNSSNERMRITDTGNVGIGTTTPFGLLNIAKNNFPFIELTDTSKTGSSSNLFVGNYAGGLLIGQWNTALSATNTLIKISDNGNRDVLIGVGVGPDKDFLPNNSAYTHIFPSVNIGYYAAQNAISSTTVSSAGPGGYGNTAVGSFAAQTATTSSEVTAIGSFALNNATGSFNTAVGMDAGRGISSGSSNTAIGNDSMITGSTGVNNTTLGWEAGAGLGSAGSYNTILGAQAAFVANNISFNTMIGDAADYNITSGSNNVLMGYNVSNNVPTQNKNVIIGVNAGLGTSGSNYSNNSIIGYQAANSLTLGGNNTFLGYQTGFNVTTGYDNVILGETQNTGGGNITTGGGNILIGYNAIVPGGATAKNQMNIGNLLFATGLATSSNTTAASIAPAGSFGVGTTSPGFLLDVYSTATTTTRIDSNSTSKGGCLVMKDSDGSGYTYITANNGVLTASTVACN